MKGLTDIEGIKVGHASDFDALTGCTAILCPAGAVAGKHAEASRAAVAQSRPSRRFKGGRIWGAPGVKCQSLGVGDGARRRPPIVPGVAAVANAPSTGRNAIGVGNNRFAGPRAGRYTWLRIETHVVVTDPEGGGDE